MSTPINKIPDTSIKDLTMKCEYVHLTPHQRFRKKLRKIYNNLSLAGKLKWKEGLAKIKRNRTGKHLQEVNNE